MTAMQDPDHRQPTRSGEMIAAPLRAAGLLRATRLLPAGLLICGLLALGCGDGGIQTDLPASGQSAEGLASADPMPTQSAAVVFTEVAQEVGIDFVHNTGAFGQKWLPETMGSGCAWIDYDVDGDADALLLSGSDFDGHATARRQTMALFRNDNGLFVEVTAAAGLDSPGYTMGVTYADYDGDGDPDVYITTLGRNRLYRNDDGVFVDVAEDLGVDDDGFGSSASWFDYDRDGDPDLFTLNYVQWTPETDLFCSLDGTNKSYCTPEVYPGGVSRLYRNDGKDGFTDVTEASGIHDATGKSLGIICFDYDGDGFDDVFVANDTQPNLLFRNRGDGTFSEEGMMAGVAFDEAGVARGAMGVDITDFNRSGKPSLVVGNFSNEMLAIYNNEGAGFFIDSAPTSPAGRQSLLTLAFATFFFDFDLDGFPDIFVANGHVEDEIHKVQERVAYAQAPHLFRNLGGGRFDDVAPQSAALSEPMVARGAATADYDGDGDLDLLVVTKGGRAKLLRNDGADGTQGIHLDLVGGAGSNPDGYGARITVDVAGAVQTAWARAAHSYCSQSAKTMTFGIGSATQADEIVVYWPSGKTSRLTAIAAGSRLTVREEEAG
jgi:hypothetical protein